jgi:glycosyltransferase involved in cell wall biosynthesis
VLVKIFPKLSETFILEEILGLERMGMALRLYALAPATDAVVHPAVARVQAPLVQVPALGRNTAWEFFRRHAWLLLDAPLRYLGALGAALRRGRVGLHDFLRAGWLARQLRRDGVGHLHVHFISSPADVAELTARVAAMPYSISAHAKDIYLSDPADLRRKMASARFTVSCTDFNCQALHRVSPLAHVHRMHHGVDHMLFHPQQRRATAGPPLILSVGRLREKKGLDILIDACALLRDQGQAFVCQIVGYGEEQARLQARIDGLGLQNQVTMLGKLAREQVITCYAQAAVYVQPSRIAADGDRDGIPNVLLEAMAMALPVVATRVSGIPELVRDGHNGLLVEPDAPAALAGAISSMLLSPVLGQALGRAARDTVTRGFDNDVNLRVLCGLLQDSATRSSAAGAGGVAVPAAGTGWRSS